MRSPCPSCRQCTHGARHAVGLGDVGRGRVHDLLNGLLQRHGGVVGGVGGISGADREDCDAGILSYWLSYIQYDNRLERGGISCRCSRFWRCRRTKAVFPKRRYAAVDDSRRSHDPSLRWSPSLFGAVTKHPCSECIDKRQGPSSVGPADPVRAVLQGEVESRTACGERLPIWTCLCLKTQSLCLASAARDS